MKTLLLFNLLCLGFMGYGQNIPTKQEPFKECNVIVIENSHAPTDAFTTMLSILVEQGFPISFINEQRLSILTDFKSFQSGTVSNMNVNCLVIENRVILSGMVEISHMGGLAKFPIENKGVMGDARKRAFQQLEAIATLYPEGRVLYGWRK